MQRRRGRARWLASACAVRSPRLVDARSRKRTRAGRSTSSAWLPNPILTLGALFASHTGRSLVGLEPQAEAFCPSSALGFGKQRRLGDASCQILAAQPATAHSSRKLGWANLLDEYKPFLGAKQRSQPPPIRQRNRGLSCSPCPFASQKGAVDWGGRGSIWELQIRGGSSASQLLLRPPTTASYYAPLLRPPTTASEYDHLLQPPSTASDYDLRLRARRLDYFWSQNVDFLNHSKLKHKCLPVAYKIPALSRGSCIPQR